MTLATVPSYDADRVSVDSELAVVVGGSVAGLLAARVLADGFQEVVVLDRDPLPTEPEPRRGVPQGHQIHLLHEAGRATMADLFPGYGEEVVAAGGLELDYGTDFDFYSGGDYIADTSTRLPVYVATRPLYEGVIRRFVSDHDKVTFRTECQCTDYLLDDSGTAVEGVAVRDGETQSELRADLVVDATGRTSSTPSWLAANGYQRPPTDEVQIDMAYCSTYIERPADEQRAFYALPEAPRSRGALIHPVEDGRWIVTMIGMHGDHPPTDPEEFEAFAGGLPVAEPRRLLEEHDRVSDIQKYPFPNHQRHRYEELEGFPTGLVVVGDAVCSFNPMYAQGMSVAALEAAQLHNALAESDREDLARRFFGRAESVVDIAWSMAVGSDMEFEGTEGPAPSGSALFDRYMDRVSRTAHADPKVAEAVHRVVRLEEHPSSLLRPGTVWRVLKPTG